MEDKMRFELKWRRRHGVPDVLQYRELNEDDPRAAHTEWKDVPIDGPFLTDTD